MSRRAGVGGSASGRRAAFGLVCACVLGLAALLGSGASSAGATEACGNEAIRVEQHSTYLSDCRAYEMVSPPDKNGGDVMSDATRIRLATDGSAAEFSSKVPFGDVVGTGVAIDYMSVRGEDGWHTHAITPEQESLNLYDAAGGARGSTYTGEFSPDLSQGIFSSYSSLPGTPSTVADIPNLYLRTDLRESGPGAYRLLSNCLPPPNGPCASPFTRSATESPLTNRSNFTAASTGFSHILFESTNRLTNDAPETPWPKLYEYEGGAVRYATMIPSGSSTSCTGSACVPAPLAYPGKRGCCEGSIVVPVDVLSREGSRFFFVVPSGAESSSEEGTLYVRDDQGTADLSDDTTTRINVDEPQARAAGPATFWDASADGTKAFFTVGEHLFMWAQTPDSSGHHLTQLSQHPTRGVIGVSADGSYVYFLQRTPAVEAQEAEQGIYLWHAGSEKLLGSFRRHEHLTHSSDDVAKLMPAYETVADVRTRVTPDGKHLLVLLSESPVDGHVYGECENEVGERHDCLELYLYDADEEAPMRCVSCPPGTATSDASIGLRDINTAAATAPGRRLNHPITEAGRYVFFSTAGALVSEDVNGVEDAYRYDTQTGEVALLSSGNDSSPSYFEEASPDGHDALILTRARLTGWDRDGAYDLYDVRVDGGFAEPHQTAAGCEGEACRSGASPPGAATPGSSTLVGPGNTVPRHPCRRGHRHRHRHHGSHRRGQARARKGCVGRAGGKR